MGYTQQYIVQMDSWNLLQLVSGWPLQPISDDDSVMVDGIVFTSLAANFMVEHIIFPELHDSVCSYSRHPSNPNISKCHMILYPISHDMPMIAKIHRTGILQFPMKSRLTQVSHGSQNKVWHSQIH